MFRLLSCSIRNPLITNSRQFISNRSNGGNIITGTSKLYYSTTTSNTTTTSNSNSNNKIGQKKLKEILEKRKQRQEANQEKYLNNETSDVIISDQASGLQDDKVTPELMDDIYRQNKLKDKSHLPELDMGKLAVNRHIERAFNEGADAYENGNFAEALDKYSWIIGKVPYHCESYLQRAIVYETMDQYDLAITDCQAVIKMSNKADELAEAHMLKGLCLMGLNHYKEASNSFKESLILVENEEVMNLKKRADALINPDVIKIPTYDDDYEFYNHIQRELGDSVMIKRSNVHGRGMFATRDYGPEELIFETRSIASIGDKETDKVRVGDIDSHHCHNCHISFNPVEFTQEHVTKSREYQRLKDTVSKMTRLPVGEIIPEECDKCKKINFCSPECASDGMRQHKMICQHDGVLSNLAEDLSKEISTLSNPQEKIVHLLLYKLISTQLLVGDSKHPIRDLELDDYVKRFAYSVPAEKTSPEQLVNGKKNVRIFQLFNNIFKTRKISKEMFSRLLSMVQLNSMSIFTSRIAVECQPAPMDELGFSFDFDDLPNKTLSTLPMHLPFINHSCEPNVFIASPVINDKQIRIVTKKAIKRGEELFMSYIEGEQLTTESRRQSLLEGFGFKCTCPACVNNITLQYLTKVE